MTSGLNFKCCSVKHIQSWGKELKEYLIFFLTSLNNQNYSACLEKSLLPKLFNHKFNYGLQGVNKTSSVLIPECIANQLPQCQPTQFSLNYPVNMGNHIPNLPGTKTYLRTTLTTGQHWQREQGYFFEKWWPLWGMKEKTRASPFGNTC